MRGTSSAPAEDDVVTAPKVAGGMGFRPTAAQVRQFQDDGVLVVRSLFTPDEAALVSKIGKATPPESVIWLSADTQKPDVYNGVAHARRIVETLSLLLEDEVYLYHYKMIQKEAQFSANTDTERGNHWVWHQDYGYWYNNNALAPDMGSCMVALDPATRENGCLQVLRGSHRLGRLNHGAVADGRVGLDEEVSGSSGSAQQHGADPQRVQLAQAAGYQRLYCELDPGDAIFFHCNTLHRSDAIRPGGDPRWALICCYNTKHNLVDDNPGHPSFRPLEIWDDSRVLQLGQEQWKAMENGSWDSGLSRQAQLELEKQLERAATTLTEGQKKALSKTIRTQGEIGGDGYETRRTATAKL